MDKAKILIFDIETRGLVADYGSVFCIGWKWLGEKTIHVKSIHDIPGGSDLDDKALVKWFLSEIWDKADIAVGWYSGPHDEAFLRTRAIIHKLPAPKDVTTLDLWGKVWKRFKFSKNSLDNVARHLGLSPKWYNPTADFEKVLYGDKAAMQRIKRHCSRDVEITEQAYERFKSYIVTHPRVTHNSGACRVCGGTDFLYRGYSYSAAKGKQHKVKCKKEGCGAWNTIGVRDLKSLTLKR
jgi:uncharacterized protein YprB with RNaseH-like and TPR domain